MGEGIGNTGVGFKSVLQICDSPEIYSCDPADPDRDGYCFGFADTADVRQMTPDEATAAAVLENVSRYTVPVPIATVPGTVRSLREQGFRTVLRLPLRNGVAASEVDKRFDELNTSSVPVMLFLERMSTLQLHRRGGDSSDSDTTFETTDTPTDRHRVRR